MSAVTHPPDGPVRDRSRLAVVALLVAGLLWGLTWIPLKYFGGLGLNGVALAVMSYGLVGLVSSACQARRLPSSPAEKPVLPSLEMPTA